MCGFQTMDLEMDSKLGCQLIPLVMHKAKTANVNGIPDTKLNHF